MFAVIETKMLFDLSHTAAKELFSRYRYPFEVLAGLKGFIEEYGKTLSVEEYTEIAPAVWVHKTATVAPTAYVGAPTVIGAGTEVRHGAYIRGSALIGEGCVVGNSTEIKNAVLFDGVQVPHYNYVGDSVLGYKAHMGAGSIASNVRSDKKPVSIKRGEERLETGLRKLGTILGDYAEIGCNSVLCPGSVVGRHGVVYPLTRVIGVVEENEIRKK